MNRARVAAREGAWLVQRHGQSTPSQPQCMRAAMRWPCRRNVPSFPHGSSGSCRCFSNTVRRANDSLILKEEGKKRSLTLEVPQAVGETPATVLAQKIPASSKGFDRFVAARTEDGALLSMNAALPPNTKSLQMLSYDDADPAGHEAVELSTAYLAAAALKSKFGDRLLCGKVTSASEGTSTSGFSCEFLLADRPVEYRGDAIGRSSPFSRHDAVLELLRQQTSNSGLDDANLLDLEKRMMTIASSAQPIKDDRIDVTEALELFKDSPLALERVEALSARSPDRKVRIIRIGTFVDVGPPHDEGAVVGSTKVLSAFKLTCWSRATWTPTEASLREVVATQSLIRLRGISFSQPSELKAHLAAAASAAASDHRVIGKAQSLFLTHSSSPGTPFLLPHGMRLARKMERVVRDLYSWYRYDEVQSPQIFRKSMWERSGHWDNYRDDMFAVEGYKEREMRKECGAHGNASGGAEHEAFGLKPMNCPGHCLIFASEQRSYRDLPIRYAEFSPLHRNEPSGSLSGLTRVRRFHQDDAHVFCSASQVGSEISSMLAMLSTAYTTFGFSSYELVLSTRPPKFVGRIEDWNRAEVALREALDQTGLPWALNEADGAFYGPKIDVRLIDASGRRHQTATIQLDFQLPQRFDLQYRLPSGEGAVSGEAISAAESDRGNDSKGSEPQLPATHARPVLIHRAILGSVERFMAILIEQTAGWWPFWLSPRQAIILPVGASDAVFAHSRRVQRALSLGRELDTTSGAASGRLAHPEQTFHVEMDLSSDSLSKMVRRAQVERYNFILVVGEREAENGTVSVRVREDSSAPKAASDLVQRLVEEQGRPKLEKDMGEWTVERLRELFSQLDSNHW